MWGYVTFLLVIVLLFLGRKVERTLELAQWFMIAWIFIFLLFVDIFLVSADTWGRTIGGLFQFGSVPAGADWVLLGAFAAYSGAGGVINGFVTNWFRDKGFGMGSTVGYIPGAIGGEKRELKPTGSVFKPSEKNMANWKAWYRYVDADQYWLWAGGALIGMLLTVTLTVHFVPKGTPVSGMAIAAFQASRPTPWRRWPARSSGL
ncbi:MAG: Nramp family divalent metal transporter [Bacteroidetes bacterium]|nr:Nramp family divalent metal transporter [Bacteroidota bacterium]